MTLTYHVITAFEKARIRQEPESIAGLDFLRGAAIGAAPPGAWAFDIESDRPPLPHLLGGRIPMASETLLAVLRNTGIDNIQTFPAVVRFRGGATWTQHSVFNVIGMIDATAGTRALPFFRPVHDPATLVVDGRVMRALNAHRPQEGWGFSAFEID